MNATPRTKTVPVPALGVPTAPPLPEDLEALLRRLRLPHIRRHAPEVVATAKAQRWEPVEVLRALFKEESAGRERSALATRRATAGFPTGKTFQAWSPAASSIPAPTQQALRTLEWVHRRGPMPGSVAPAGLGPGSRTPPATRLGTSCRWGNRRWLGGWPGRSVPVPRPPP